VEEQIDGNGKPAISPPQSNAQNARISADEWEQLAQLMGLFLGARKGH
jgi:hypothetical protein